MIPLIYFQSDEISEITKINENQRSKNPATVKLQGSVYSLVYFITCSSIHQLPPLG
jgi:hypothetical protein